MKKKLMSLVLAMTMILSALPAAAAVNADNVGTDFCTQVENFLLNAGTEYDISKYDNVLLGGEIPAYYVENDAENLKKSSIHYYPILAEDSVIGLLQAYTDKSGNQVFYYSEAYCDTINEFLKENALVAILGDGKSLAIVSDNKTKSLTETGHVTNSLSKCGEAISLAPVNGLYDLNIDTYQQSRAADSYMIPGVLKHGKHEIWACWAACVASYGYFYTEKHYTYTSKDVAELTKINTWAKMSQTKDALKSLYGLTPAYYVIDIDDPDEPFNLRTNKLIQYISNDDPLVAGFRASKEVEIPAHMVIIRGYASNSSSFSISIMDPDIADYALVSVSTDQPITIPLGGCAYQLNEYLVME